MSMPMNLPVYSNPFSMPSTIYPNSLNTPTINNISSNPSMYMLSDKD
jgi:hypothetical protein